MGSKIPGSRAHDIKKDRTQDVTLQLSFVKFVCGLPILYGITIHNINYPNLFDLWTNLIFFYLISSAARG